MARGGMFVFDGIGPVLDYMFLTTASRVAEAMEEGRQRVEYYAQMNAPWTDDTGEARGGLTTELELELGEVVLTLFHTADHGYWLELIQDGNFAIIMPTLEALGPEILWEAGGQVVNTGGY